MRYAIMYNQDAKTLSIVDEGADSTSSATEGTAKSVGTLVYAEFGEVPTAETHPQPLQHLENIARTLAVNPAEITIKNETGNDRLDQFEREGREVSNNTFADAHNQSGDENVQANALEAAQRDPSETIKGSDTDGLDSEVDPKAAGEAAEKAALDKGASKADAKKAGKEAAAAAEQSNKDRETADA